MTEPVDPFAVLIAAWTEWDHAAANMPRFRTAATLEREAHAKEAALAALGIDGTHAHRAIAKIRHAAPTWLPGGLSVGDAVQTFLNELGLAPLPAPDPQPLKEAS